MSHLREMKVWVKWMRARHSKRGTHHQRAARADRLQYQLEDMSPYGRSLVWGYPGREMEKQWARRRARKTRTRGSR
ncbi:MAG: hypothetical protein ACYDH4_11350 [Candidatus Cryosericum sp.]